MERLLIRLQGLEKRVELRLLAIGGGINSCCLGIGFANSFLRLAVRFRANPVELAFFVSTNFRAGAIAQISWSAAPRASVDLLLLGNHGALYYDAGTGNLWEESISLPEGKPDANVLAWVERALRSGRPETADK